MRETFNKIIGNRIGAQKLLTETSRLNGLRTLMNGTILKVSFDVFKANFIIILIIS